MNISDSEIVVSILNKEGFTNTNDEREADVIFVNTCAIREGAEQKVRKRLTEFRKLKKSNPALIVGILGCMAERVKEKLLEEEKLVDIVVGPDAYRGLPDLIKVAETGQKAVNVLLSKEETYADLAPVRLGKNAVTAFISITRGCDNMCSFCVVPFTRGRERSRDPETIVQEAIDLFKDGYREVTLLGQNVDSYLWTGGGLKKQKVTEEEMKKATTFSQLLVQVSKVNPDLRVRFSTSHPKDLSDDVIYAIRDHENICNYIHLPVQSGSSKVLEMMNRGYTREWYINRIDKIKEIIPDCAISTDIITGFCDETEEEHKETVSLMELVKYNFAYMYAYSERPNTKAERKFTDNVPEEEKLRRLREIIEVQLKYSRENIKNGVGKVHKVLVESISKKSKEKLSGRNSENAVVVFPKENFKPGDYVNILVTTCTGATLIGHAVKND
jgi:tRNA-2-methylthio-N6-dimethylallyladenosine synthase